MRLRANPGACLAVLAVLAFPLGSLAQQPLQQGTEPAATAVPGRLQEYVLGPNDEFTILSVQAEEIANRSVRVSTAGDINLPMVGRIQVAGMTVQELELELTERLKAFFKQPQVAVSVTQFKSQPVNVIGAVASPGIIQLEGRRNLLEVILRAGGPSPEASARVMIMRPKEYGPIPLSTAIADPASAYSVAEVNYAAIQDGTHTEQNIEILPNDIISVQRARVVYAMGQVSQPGGYVLRDRDAMSVLQLIALAHGLTPTASKKDAKIIRPVPGGERIELEIDLAALLDGKVKDMMLQPEDMLVVADSYAKGAFRRTLDILVGMAPGMVIYR